MNVPDARTRRRVLVGQFFHETHGFNPRPTTGSYINVERGAEVLKKARGGGTTLVGLVRTFERLGFEIVPAIAVFAQPSGPLDHDFYLRMREELLSAASRRDVDVVALDMHGAMCTTRLTDADGDLLMGLRHAVGPDIPIGIGLDMHAHVTSRMLSAVDICIACKECPHVDFPECGDRVAQCLDAMLKGELDPVMAMAKAPMIHLDSGLTACGPLAEVKAAAESRAAANELIRDISLFQVYRFADYAEQKGQTALVLANGDARIASQVAEELASWFWDNRERFRDRLPGIDEVLDLVAASTDGRPFVLADTGDRTMAGAPGDSTAILEHVLARPDRLRGVFPVTDPDSVGACSSAGVGATVTLSIGGCITPGFAPLQVSGVVLRLGDGQFQIDGPVFEGERCSLGQTALLVIDDRLTVLLMSEPGLTHSPAAFTSQGVDLRVQDFVVSKSGQHFRANFDGIATPLVVETPGLSFPARGFFQWTNPHFWPEENLTSVEIQSTVFRRTRASERDGHLEQNSRQVGA